MSSDGGVWVKIGGNEDTTPPAIVSGGTVTTYVDSGITYQVNTFTSDGTLNVSSEGVADMLIVGAGGGGGNINAGGAGAGGFNEISNAYLSKGSKSVVIGQGGAGATADINYQFGGDNGTGSSVAGYSAGGGAAGAGGYGGATTRGKGWAGASGGGSSLNNVLGGGGTPGQGFAAGAGVGTAGGGGGGASGAGDDADYSATRGGNGGPAKNSSITGVQLSFAGGGGGASQGGQDSLGGAGLNPTGGIGTKDATPGGNGVVNTGGGGGGGGYTAGGGGVGGTGGSGIVIVRTITSNSRPGTVVASGGLETTFTGDGSNGDLGQDYKVHTFTSDGTLSVSVAGEVDALLVGGGGWRAVQDMGEAVEPEVISTLRTLTFLPLHIT